MQPPPPGPCGTEKSVFLRGLNDSPADSNCTIWLKSLCLFSIVSYHINKMTYLTYSIYILCTRNKLLPIAADTIFAFISHFCYYDHPVLQRISFKNEEDFNLKMSYLVIKIHMLHWTCIGKCIRKHHHRLVNDSLTSLARINLLCNSKKLLSIRYLPSFYTAPNSKCSPPFKLKPWMLTF